MKLLHIDASILGDNSVSRQLSGVAVERLRKSAPDLVVTYRDLGAKPLAHLDVAHLTAVRGPTPVTQTAEIADSIAALDEFLAADIVVIGAPMYNFSVPSQLKAWIDRILVAGKTFGYSEKGDLQGFAGGKRVIVTISRGNFYGAGMPAAAGEHLETYLRWVFGFIGITDVEIIAADGIHVSPEQREKSVTEALQAAVSLKAASLQAA